MKFYEMSVASFADYLEFVILLIVVWLIVEVVGFLQVNIQVILCVCAKVT